MGDHIGTALIATATLGTTLINHASGSYQTSGNNTSELTTIPPRGKYSWQFLVTSLLYGLSIVFLAVTLFTYTCCLNQKNNSNYVKHYVAMIFLSLILNVIQENIPIPAVFNHQLFYLFKLFIVLTTHCWQIVMAIDIFLYIRYVTIYNMFKNTVAKRNVCYHIGCWGSSSVLVYIVYLCQKNSDTVCFDSKITSTIFPTMGLFFILINGSLLYRTIYCYNELKNVRRIDEKWNQLEKKMLVRKLLFILTLMLWFSDTVYWIKCNNFFWESDMKITSILDVMKQTKVVQGLVASYVLMFSAGILKVEDWGS